MKDRISNHASNQDTFTVRLQSSILWTVKGVWVGRWLPSTGWRYKRLNGRKWRPRRQLPKRIRHYFEV